MTCINLPGLMTYPSPYLLNKNILCPEGADVVVFNCGTSDGVADGIDTTKIGNEIIT